MELRDVIAERTLIEGSWVLDAEGRTISISPTAAAMIGRDPEDVRGCSPLQFVDAVDLPRLRQALARRRHGSRESYEIRWRRADGATVWALMAAAPMVDADGTYAGSFALVTDVTEQRRADERTTRYAAQQEAVAQLGKLALDDASVESLFDAAVRCVAKVLDADYVSVFRRDGERLVHAAVHGLPAGAARDLALTREDAAPPVPRLATGEPLVIPDWELETELRQPREVQEHLAVRSTVAVPISGREPYGAIAASRVVPWAPHDDEVRFLEAIAHVLAAAIGRAEAEDAGRHGALHDVLTGLPNRTLALDRLDLALRRRREEDAGILAILSVDLDRFKLVNDTFGVAAGDEVVREIAARLSGLVGSADTVARLAGDAFVVVCEDLDDEESAAAIAGRIVEALRAPVRVGDEELVLTGSVGLALACGGAAGAGDVLRDADAAMARAKAHGRDRFELFDEALRSRAVERVQLERDLRQAIARGELFVAHQPIVAVGSGQVIGTEALARWRHPERGVVPPGDFIGLAEEAGLIADIGMWVLRQACADVAERHRTGRALTCHVNLSPLQAADPTLPEQVAAVLRDSGLPPEALVLELTESSLMEAGEGPLCVLQGIRDLGVRLVLDDFGTGYSSLSRLRHFPIDGLKIDRSFVIGLDESCQPADALLVSGIVELARALGLTVVAEGVETEVQLGRLERIGCRYAQGFLLARPGTLEQLDAAIALDTLRPAA